MSLVFYQCPILMNNTVVRCMFLCLICFIHIQFWTVKSPSDSNCPKNCSLSIQACLIFVQIPSRSLFQRLSLKSNIVESVTRPRPKNIHCGVHRLTNFPLFPPNVTMVIKADQRTSPLNFLCLCTIVRCSLAFSCCLWSNVLNGLSTHGTGKSQSLLLLFCGHILYQNTFISRTHLWDTFMMAGHSHRVYTCF